VRNIFIENCAGCGLCTRVCSKGFKMVKGKAVIINEKEAKKFTDCPVNAIKI